MPEVTIARDLTDLSSLMHNNRLKPPKVAIISPEETTDEHEVIINPNIFDQERKTYLRILELTEPFTEKKISKIVNKTLDAVHDPTYETYARK